MFLYNKRQKKMRKGFDKRTNESNQRASTSYYPMAKLTPHVGDGDSYIDLRGGPSMRGAKLLGSRYIIIINKKVNKQIIMRQR